MKRVIELELQEVESSNLKAVGFHSLLGLIVEFLNGGVYAYPGQKSELRDQLLSAESVGGAFHNLVKKPGLAFVRLA